MAEFKEALQKTLQEEGYWADLDGGTYRGITRKWHRNWKGWNIIDKYVKKIGRPLEWNEKINDVHLDALVASFYRTNYWQPFRCEDIECQRVANNLFDWSVNSWDDAAKQLQGIVGVKQDGDIGLISLAAINAAGCDIMDRYQAARVLFYRNLGGKYSDSWIKRSKRF